MTIDFLCIGNKGFTRGFSLPRGVYYQCNAQVVSYFAWKTLSIIVWPLWVCVASPTRLYCDFSWCCFIPYTVPTVGYVQCVFICVNFVFSFHFAVWDYHYRLELGAGFGCGYTMDRYHFHRKYLLFSCLHCVCSVVGAPISVLLPHNAPLGLPKIKA